jgi:hypothetical protein
MLSLEQYSWLECWTNSGNPRGIRIALFLRGTSECLLLMARYLSDLSKEMIRTEEEMH